MPLTRPIRGCAGRFFAARSSEGAASQRPYEGKSKKAKAKAKAKGEGKGKADAEAITAEPYRGEPLALLDGERLLNGVMGNVAWECGGIGARDSPELELAIGEIEQGEEVYAEQFEAAGAEIAAH